MSKPLSIGLDLVYLVERSGGSGTYARELIPNLLELEPDTRITAFVSREAPESLLDAPWAPAVNWVRFPLNVTHGPRGNFALKMAGEWGVIPLVAAKRRMDVVHGLANVAPLFAPTVATVVTLLDLIWLRFPETMERSATVGMKQVAPISARRADRVIAISEAARRDLIDVLALPPGKVDVTPLGFRPRTAGTATNEPVLRAKFALGEARIVLCVAQKRQHKNLDGLLRAIALLPDRDLELVLPGAPTPHESVLKALAEELGISDRVHFLGWLSDADLNGLYQLATCFVLPSFDEGFGLPVLEAMGRGVPVACSNATSLPEVVGDAALLFDPRRFDEIAAAVTRIAGDSDLARDLTKRGRRRSEEFEWRATARATLASYRRAINSRRGANVP